MSVTQRIGIMGGTFNPIHHGHLLLAEQVRTEYGLDRVIFVPSGRPPHKNPSSSEDPSGEQRLEMARLATADNPQFEVSDIETHRPGSSYTIDTVAELKLRHPDAELVFITGADVVLELDQWREHSKLLRMIRFVAAARPGTDIRTVRDKIAQLHERFGAEIELVEISALAISSTEIRERVDRCKSIRYLVPREVELYIRNHDLYRRHHEDYAVLWHLTRATLKPERFAHSISVAETARRLAFRHGADPLKAELAGLVHDYAKELTREQCLSYIRQYSIQPSDLFERHPGLAHGEIAAYLLRDESLVTDEEVLDAVRWHTYGHPRMSLLAKIVYVADLIEPTRSDFDGLREARRAAEKSPDDAILAWAPYNAALLEAKGHAVHPNTAELLRVLRDNR